MNAVAIPQADGSVPGRRGVRTTWLLSVLILLAASVLAEKTDVLTMRNGNVIVGEVKKLERGILEYSVDDISNRLQIKWEHVVRLTCNQNIDIELRDGTKFFGNLVPSAGDGKLRIQSALTSIDVELNDVVMITPIKGTFLKRLEGNISAGLSFTKATDIFQTSLGGSVRYRRLISLTEFKFNAIFTSTSGEPSRANVSAPLTHYRFFKNRWFYRGDLAASRNDELGIDFRGAVGGGGGRRLVQTSRVLFALSGLLIGNREFTSDGLVTNNAEVALDTRLDAFRYDTPKLDLSTGFVVFVSLTTSGRYRVNYDGRLSMELGIKDFFWDITQLYYTYDSDPSQEAAARDDYGIVSALRYKW